MRCIRFVFCLLIFFIYFGNYTADETKQTPFLQQISEEVISGILKANYRETPIDEVLPLRRVPISKIKFPTKSEHPILLFSKLNDDQIRMRRYREPYSKWAEQIIDAALRINSDPASPLLNELTRSRMAKLNTFAWFLTRNIEFSQTAKSALLNIGDTRPPVTAEGGRYGEGWGDWMQAAEALQNYAVAYDILFYEFTETERTITEQQLAAQINQIYRYFSRLPKDFSSTQLSIGIGIPKNNHIIDIACGVATIALVIEHRDSKEWFDTAITQIQSGLSLIMKDGSYREGAYYGRFIASRLYPFFVYLYNTTGENLFKHPLINKFSRWLIAMEKPNGAVPDFDDAFPERYLFQPMAVGLSPLSSEFRFLFELHQDRFSKFDPAFIDVFCAFDDRIISRKPVFETTFKEGGYQIFRGNNEIFGLFLAEPGRPYISNHDHIEPTNFTLSAFNKDLLIDSGYGPGGVNNKDRNWFISARAHNIPLINGFGPDQNPAWGDCLGGKLENVYQSEYLSSAQVSSYYRDTDIKRKILFVSKEYFIVLDQLKSDYKNRYSIPWHGLGDYTRLSPSEVLWKQNDVTLNTEFLTMSPYSISTRQGLHTLKQSDFQHTTASIDFKPTTNIELLSIFIPTENESISTEHIAVHSEGRSEARMIRGSDPFQNDYLIISELEWNCENFHSDAKTAFIISNTSTYIFLEDVTFFYLNDDLIFSSDQPVDIVLDIETFCGLISLNDLKPATIKLFQNTDPGMITFNNKLIDYQWNGESSCISITKSGELQSGFIANRNPVSEPAYNVIPMLYKLSSSFDPQIEFNDLSFYEKTQLYNEIIDFCSNELINQVDSLTSIPDFTSKLYGTASGLIRSMWDASENFKFNLPQTFKLNRNIGSFSCRYYEEGIFTDKGLKIRKHRLSIGNMIYISHDRDFSNHNLSFLQLNFAEFMASTNWENYNNLNSYQVELQKDNENGWVQASHSNNEFDDQISTSLSFLEKYWTGDLAVNRKKGFYEYFLSGRKTGNILSTAFNTTINSDKQVSSGNFYNSIRFSDKLQFTNNLFYFQNEENDTNLKSSSSLLHRFELFSGKISFLRESDEKNYFKASEVIYLRNWRISGHYTNEVYTNFIVSHRSRKISTETCLENAEIVSQKITYHPAFSLTPHFRAGWNIRKNQYREIALGIYHNDFQRIGTEISWSNENDDNLVGLSCIIDLKYNQNESLSIYSSLFWQDDGDIKKYELIISQNGASFSPGIYISRDQTGFSRCEGYLIWKF